MSRKAKRPPKHMQKIKAWRCNCGHPECLNTMVAMGSAERFEAIIWLDPDEATAIAAEILASVPAAGHA